MISELSQPKNMKHIVIVTDSFGFPNGMASTHRIKLIAKALIDHGNFVNVMCVRALERAEHLENTKTHGTYHGINFEYTPGTTIRSQKFWVRRFIDIKGIYRAINKLIIYKKRGELSCIYYYGTMLSRTLNRWIFYLLSTLLRVPLVIELCERPWMLERRSLSDRYFHPLISVDGVIVISSYLKAWMMSETSKRGKKIKFLELPILVDVEEQHVSALTSDKSSVYVLFAGSSNYSKTVEFILDSMAIVWKKYPECKLMLTGYRTGTEATNCLHDQLEQQKISAKVSVVEYLPRAYLLNLYKDATALLIPLFDDIRSKARFPTKIGEYLCSGIPIVTNNVGEIPRYFTDEINAYICEPEIPELYAQKIMDVIEPRNNDLAFKVGNNGRSLAEKCFDYRNYGDSLEDFFSSICN